MTKNKHLDFFLKILEAVIFFGVGILITRYERNTADVGEFFYPATVIIGILVGIVSMIILFCTEQNPTYLKEHPRPKTSRIVLIVALLRLTLVLAAAGIIASMLRHPDMASHAGFTHLFGFIPAVAAVCILWYLPHVLPQREEKNESFEE